MGIPEVDGLNIVPGRKCGFKYFPETANEWVLEVLWGVSELLEINYLWEKYDFAINGGFLVLLEDFLKLWVDQFFLLSLLWDDELLLPREDVFFVFILKGMLPGEKGPDLMLDYNNLASHLLE